MKVLFYLEPHPIRNSTTQHVWVGQQICRMLRNYYVAPHSRIGVATDFRLLVTRHQHKHLGEEFPDLARAFIGLSKDENNSIEPFVRPWDSEAMRIWINVMEGRGDEADLYYSMLSRVKRTVFDFDHIVYWGTNGTVKRFAASVGICATAMELGATRSRLLETVYMDPVGVNGEAVTQLINIDRVPGVDLARVQSTFPVDGFGSVHDAIYERLRGEVSRDIYRGIGRNVLVPMQLDDDSNLLMHSQYNSMFELLEEVVPRLTGAGYKCFVKAHPGAASRRIPGEGHAVCREYIEGMPGCHWIEFKDANEYLSLLHKMDGVVTNNSSMGFEAMLLGKTVVPMGKSCYSIPGVHPSLDQFVSGEYDHEKYLERLSRVVNLLLYHYLVPRYMAFDMHNFESHLRRIARYELISKSADRDEITQWILSSKSATCEDYSEYPQRVQTWNSFSTAPRHTSITASQFKTRIALAFRNPALFKEKVKGYIQRKIHA